METTTEKDDTNPAGLPPLIPVNDNAKSSALGRMAFPHDVVAHIHKPSRSVLTSGRGRAGSWRLVFERRTPHVIEPLMGYTGGNDTLTQVELSFPTLNSALRYAERQGLTYTVRGSAEQYGVRGSEEPKPRPVDEKRSTRAFSDATLDRLGLTALQHSYGEALEHATSRDDAAGHDGWAWPMAVVGDPALTLDAKRSILMNWAWTEFLIDHANNERTSQNGQLSCLHEVEQAVLALEREVAADRDDSSTQQAA